MSKPKPKLTAKQKAAVLKYVRDTLAAGKFPVIIVTDLRKRHVQEFDEILDSFPRARKVTNARTLLMRHADQPRPDRRYIRRRKDGTIKSSVSVSRSLKADRRTKAKRAVKKGQGDRGDVR